MKTVILVTSDQGLLRQIRSMMLGARVLAVPCLRGVEKLVRASRARVIVDPDSMQACCLDSIRRGPRRIGRHSESRRGRAHDAWLDRARILAPEGVAEPARALVEAASSHDHDAYSVDEAAWDLGLNPRRLNRLSMGIIGYPPGIVLGLARIVSAAREIRQSRAHLGSIARSFNFRDSTALARMFVRYVGVPPSSYRMLSEPDHGPRISHGAP